MSNGWFPYRGTSFGYSARLHCWMQDGRVLSEEEALVIWSSFPVLDESEQTKERVYPDLSEDEEEEIDPDLIELAQAMQEGSLTAFFEQLGEGMEL